MSTAKVGGLVDELRELAGVEYHVKCCNDTFPIAAARRVMREAADALSAHGQPVVDDQMVLNACAAFHGERWPDADSPFERQRMRAALRAAITGATP